MKVTHLNLLPDSIRRKYVVREVIKLWSRVALVAILAAGVIAGLAWHDTAAKRENAEKLQKQLDPLMDIDSRLTRVRADMRETVSKLAISLKPESNSRPLLTLMGTVSTATESCNGTVCLDDLELQRISRHTAQRETAGSYLLKLEGLATEKTAIEQFISNLENSKRFLRVQLVATQESQQENIPVVRYEVHCSF